MKILIYYGKHGNQYWMVDTARRMDGAMRQLFDQLDEMHCYEDVEDCNEAMLRAARQGGISVIRRLLDAHNGAEYECWEIEEAEIVE
jgi:hypothetical protein